ncbi:rho guanine nucleotide exchange factor 40-like, partial [Thunnus maccoyii]|uniref:rho guanine nucleotide exchange factor 40-like n=1 Tax=Thunnus maccoyii TaxID=8240 RepID=UPI001C4C1FE4
LLARCHRWCFSLDYFPSDGEELSGSRTPTTEGAVLKLGFRDLKGIIYWSWNSWNLREEDSESLDRCIQTALSSLYPPFQATSPTVLCQVLSVVESRYRGDGLRYLIHFLLPAKQFLQNIQQDACLQYCGLLFLHEGWPLCVHEKVVVQLCPLDHRLLLPGDFYLLVSPPPSPIPPQAHSASCKSGVTSSPRLLVCSVSAGSHHVEQQEVSELALRSLFSMAWLDSVNREREQRGASRLERCLLSAHGDVFRVPWEDLVYPQFISRPRTTLGEDKESSVKDGDMFINTSHDPCRDTNSPGQDVKLLPSSAKTDQSAASSESEDSEGEYVELTELPLPRFSPQKGSLTQSISLQHRARSSTHPSTHTHTHSAATHTPQNTHTLSAALIEENLSQDSCGPVILTPVSPAATASSSSSAPPEVVGTSSCQSERRMSQKEIEGSSTNGPDSEGRSWQASWQPYETRDWLRAVCSGLSGQRAVGHIVLQTSTTNL